MGRTSSKVNQQNEDLINLLELILKKHDWIEPKAGSDVKDLEKKIREELTKIYNETDRYTIQENTLYRLFRKKIYNDSYGIESTLNPLARLAGYESWGYYLNENNIAISAELPVDKIDDAELSVVKNEELSPGIQLPFDLFFDAEMLDVENLIKVGWYPTRYVDLEYLGDCEFKIVKYVGTGFDRTGDIITARWFDVVDVPADSGRPDVVQDIAGVIGEIYDRLKL